MTLIDKRLPLYFCPIARLFFFLFAEQPHIKAAATAYQEGHSAMLQNRPAAAVKLLTRAIEIEQTFIDAYKCLIEAHLVSRNRLSTAAALTRLLEIEPHAIQYRLQLAQILLAAHQPERSLAQCLLALQHDPSDRAAQAIATGRAHHPLDQRFRAP